MGVAEGLGEVVGSSAYEMPTPTATTNATALRLMAAIFVLVFTAAPVLMTFERTGRPARRSVWAASAAEPDLRAGSFSISTGCGSEGMFRGLLRRVLLGHEQCHEGRHPIRHPRPWSTS